jgi:hypothetical protein
MHEHNIGALLKRIATYIAERFPKCRRENWHLLYPLDYFTKWPEAKRH